MIALRKYGAAALLTKGQVLSVGGYSGGEANFAGSSAAEAWDTTRQHLG
ncbi:MAG TPA: hypothetical protein VNF28_01085 [Candidatus Binataceae bacterium]|nr:hypothetical protein [Candidatus Binataceae bacterium]